MTTDQLRSADLAGMSAERRELIERLVRRQQPTAGPAGGDGDRPLRISLFFFSADVDDNIREKHQVVLECAELADELGLHAVWVPERHFDPFGAPYPNPALLLAALAVRTRRIQLRAGSTVLPLHDPLLVAEDWAVLDSLSGGRMGMSIASGWHANDFVLNPAVYDSRRELVLEQIEQLRRLWAGDPVSRQAPGDRMVEIRTYPRPMQPPPLWLTSSSKPATWETAGQHGLNVLTALLEQSVDEVSQKAALYRRALSAAGHGAGEVTCMIHTHLAADPTVVRDRVRGPLKRYLSAHMDMFAKFASTADVGIRPEEVTEADRAVLLEHGFLRYFDTAGLFGSAETCLPMVDRLRLAGVTEVGCLVDFGLPHEQVVESVRELGALTARLAERTGVPG